MRYMLMIKSTPQAEAGEMPSEDQLNEMGMWNARMVSAGVMLAGEGLSSSAEGAKVQTTDGVQSVVDGPFSEAKELIGGFWMIEVGSRDEALEWARGCPVGANGEIEVRRVHEMDDFGDEFTPEARAAETRLREEIAGQHRGQGVG